MNNYIIYKRIKKLMKCFYQFQLKKLFSKNILNNKIMEEVSNKSVENLNYQDLCTYCFEVLISHLKNSNTHIKFPDGFKNVYLNNSESVSFICNMDNRRRKRFKRLHRYIR